MCMINFITFLGSFLFDTREFLNIVSVEVSIQTLKKRLMLFVINSLKLSVLFGNNYLKVYYCLIQIQKKMFTIVW